MQQAKALVHCECIAVHLYSMQYVLQHRNLYTLLTFPPRTFMQGSGGSRDAVRHLDG